MGPESEYTRSESILLWGFDRWTEPLLPGMTWREMPWYVRLRAEAWWCLGVVLSGPPGWYKVLVYRFSSVRRAWKER